MAENCNASEEERARRLARKWKRRQKANMQPLCEVRGEINEYEREEQQLAKQRKRMAVFETLLTS